MKRDLFNYLVSRGIFKSWNPSLRASKRTIEKNDEKRRLQGKLVWLSKSIRTDKDGKFIDKAYEKGTFKGNVKRDLF